MMLEGYFVAYSLTRALGIKDAHTVILEYFNIKNKHFLLLPSSLSTEDFSNAMMRFWNNPFYPLLSPVLHLLG